jgi:hypothetical protein
MFIQIAPKARVYVTDTDVKFIRAHALDSFRSDQLSPEDADRAKRLADKAIFVRKKLDAGFQYQINRRIRIIYEHKHHIKPNSSTNSLEKR